MSGSPRPGTRAHTATAGSSQTHLLLVLGQEGAVGRTEGGRRLRARGKPRPRRHRCSTLHAHTCAPHHSACPTSSPRPRERDHANTTRAHPAGRRRQHRARRNTPAPPRGGPAVPPRGPRSPLRAAPGRPTARCAAPAAAMRRRLGTPPRGRTATQRRSTAQRTARVCAGACIRLRASVCVHARASAFACVSSLCGVRRGRGVTRACVRSSARARACASPSWAVPRPRRTRG